MELGRLLSNICSVFRNLLPYSYSSNKNLDEHNVCAKSPLPFLCKPQIYIGLVLLLDISDISPFRESSMMSVTFTFIVNGTWGSSG